MKRMLKQFSSCTFDFNKSSGLAANKELKLGEAEYMKKIFQLLPRFVAFLYN